MLVENIARLLSQKKFILLLSILMFINIIIFVLPGIPANIQTILKNAPGYRIPDTVLFYTPDSLHDFLSEIGPEGRQAFQMMHATTDFAFPLIYGLFFYALLNSLMDNKDKLIKYLPLVGFLALGFDLVENFTLMIITDRFPANQPILSILAQISTPLKFFFILLSLLSVAYLGLKYHKKRKLRTG
jgi:hypothetical protein